MIVITITKSKRKLLQDIADYYNADTTDIEIDKKDCVWCCGRKKRLQVDKYKDKYVCAFVK